MMIGKRMAAFCLCAMVLLGCADDAPVTRDPASTDASLQRDVQPAAAAAAIPVAGAGSAPGGPASATCKRKTEGPLTPGYQAQIDIACQIALGSGPTVRFVRMESDQGICRPFMVGVAPNAMPFRFLIEYQLGELELRKSAFRISGTMLEDRLSGAVYLGAWEEFVETPCEALGMNIVAATCGGQACQDVRFEGTDIFASFSQPAVRTEK